MKKIFLILIVAVSVLSCKKENNAPSQQSTQSSSNTTTTTPTPTTSINDTVGKIKVFYTIGFAYVITTSTATPVVPDFKQDTSGVTIQLNGTRLTNYDVNSSVNYGLTGLTTHGDYGGTMKPIWIKKSTVFSPYNGDSLIVELDHVELRYGAGAGNNAIQSVTLKIWDEYGNQLAFEGGNQFINMTNCSTTYGNSTAVNYYAANQYAPLIGFDNTTLNIKWYLGGNFRYKFQF